MVSAITCLNDQGILIGRRKSCSQDRWISILQLDVEVRGRFSKKRTWSGDTRKRRNRLEIDERVNEVF